MWLYSIGKMLPFHNSIMNLPLEILFIIFQHLSIEDRIPLRAVSKSWKSLLFHPFLLRRLNFSATSILWEYWHEHYVDFALTRATEVLSLRFFQCQLFSGLSLREASLDGKFKKLKHLSFARTALGDSVVNTILHGAEYLEHLDLAEAELQDSDNVATTIIKCASHSLRYLRFPPAFRRIETVHKVLDSCVRLKTVSLTHSMLPIETTRALLHGKRCQNIKKLILTVDHFKSDNNFIVRLVENMEAVVRSPVLCVCDTRITEDKKSLLKNLKISVCNCGVKFD